MARKNRNWHPGGIYHVMSRGNRKAAIFKEEYDYHFFLELIGKVQMKYSFTVHSICLMTNHFHMAIGTDNIELGKIMSKILSAYAVYFNNASFNTDASFPNIHRKLNQDPTCFRLATV